MSIHPARQTHYRSCNLCEALCGLAIEVEGETILSIRGDPADPLSRGHICPKAVALQDIYSDPDRLRFPMRRTATGWERLGWDEAFDLAVAGLKKVQAAHGLDAVAVYQGNPSVHNYGTQFFAPAFIKSLKTRNRFSATSVDQLPHHLAAYTMFGHQMLIPIPDIDHTAFWLILGANPAVSNGSIMTAPDVVNRLKAIRQRGGRVVVVDPRLSETAALADAHHFIQPGTDVLLLLALLQTICAEGLVRPGAVAGFTDGLDSLPELVADFTPEVVAPWVGMDAETIRTLARDFAAADSAVCYGRIGVSVQPFGAVSLWLINVLNIVTGNLDRPGGALFTTPAYDLIPLGGQGGYGRWRSRVRGLPEVGGELPVVTLAEEILTPGEGQIRALVTSAGNPVLSTPNGQQLETALATLEWMVSIDFYLNETTRHAHLILPPTAALEHEHYDLIFHLLAIRNTAKYSPALFDPAPDTRHDWQIFQALQQRMVWEGEGAPPEKAPLHPDVLLARGLRAGPYGPDLTLETLKATPHGIDLGPLTPRLPARLATASQRIVLLPDLLVADLARVRATFLESTPENPVHPEMSGSALRLIGRRQLRSNNSWMHNSQRLVRGKLRCTLLIHPTDAVARGVSDGQPVQVRSRVGTIATVAEVSDEMMPGVVSLPHGWGHHRPGTMLQVAHQSPGASINDLTDEYLVDTLSGNAALNALLVEVAPV